MVFRHAFPSAPIIVLSEAAQIRAAVAALKAGAGAWLTYPIDAHELEYVLGSLYDSRQMESERLHLRENVLREAPLDGARTESPAMMEVLCKVKSVAATRSRGGEQNISPLHDPSQWMAGDYKEKIECHKTGFLSFEVV